MVGEKKNLPDKLSEHSALTQGDFPDGYINDRETEVKPNRFEI